MSAPRCFYFGCWNRAGHYLYGPHGGYAARDESVTLYQRSSEFSMHLDDTLAPRRTRDGRVTSYKGVTLHAGEWAKKLGITIRAMHRRVVEKRPEWLLFYPGNIRHVRK